MLLLLRAHLSPLIEQSTISDLHLGTVAQLTTADITLPYSTAFTDAFDENCDDVRRLLAGRVPGHTTDELSLPHLLVFGWLTGTTAASRTLHRPPGGVGGGRQAATEAEAVAAARSLIVRHGVVDDLVDPAPDVLDDGFAELSAGVAARREALPTSDLSGAAAIDKSRLRMETKAWQAVNAAVGMVEQRSPWPLPRRRRPKVAVCVSGQPRLPDRTRVVAADVPPHRRLHMFVHTWEKVGRSSGEAFRATLPFAGDTFTHAYREAANRTGFEEIKERYPHLFAALASSGTVDADELRDLYDTPHVLVEDDTAAPRDTWTNQDKMHAKIEAAYDLVAPSPDDYDLVVRLRPDKPVRVTAFNWRDVMTVCRTSPTILADGGYNVHYANLVIGDQFAMGHPSTMGIYSRTWSTYPDMAAQRPLRLPRAPLRPLEPGPGAAGCTASTSAGHRSASATCRRPRRWSRSDILDCLQQDATGRDDDTDRRLIAAAHADVEAAA